MRKIIQAVTKRVRRLDSIDARLERVQEALGRVEARQTSSAPNLRDAEFRTFSQWGEDGIIQALIRSVPIGRNIFIEFGVQDYSESNTRFLLLNDNWSGLVIDGDAENIDAIKSSDLYWRHNLKAECAFITRDNINDIFVSAGVQGDIGLLSIDIDGNDYWVWEAINAVDPRIVAVEYNFRFGGAEAVTIPYRDDFTRASAHSSMIYYGASLAALALLAARKGYDLVGCNSAGNNAFFVRRDVRPATLPAVTAAEAFVEGRFREARGADGALLFLSVEEERGVLKNLPLVRIDG
jgi:hypothetical protein